MGDARWSAAMALVCSALSIRAGSIGLSVDAQAAALLSMLLAADCVIVAFGIFGDHADG